MHKDTSATKEVALELMMGIPYAKKRLVKMEAYSMSADDSLEEVVKQLNAGQKPTPTSPTNPNAPLTDDSLMPFGKYRGFKISSIPASYLHWLWHNGVNQKKDQPIHKYIVDNIEGLKEEDADLIWVGV